MKEIHQIYDKAFKRILTLSEKTVINLINGLFDTEYPTDSKITYNWTEHEDKELKRTLADSILTINGRDSYHIEAQMTEDEEIVFRFIEYGFGHAYKNRTFVSGGERMVFPRPCILYLDEGKKDKVPDEYTLTLLFENLEELQNFVMDDIIDSIYKNEAVGNISYSDALDLIELTTKLYMKIYSKYKELEDLTMRMCDQSLELISDKYEKTVEELEEEVKCKDGVINELQATVAKLEEQLSELQEK